MVYELKDIEDSRTIFQEKNGRKIIVYRLKDVSICSRSMNYPNILLQSKNCDIYNPINERVMSLSSIESNFEFNLLEESLDVDTGEYFFFIYNTDNYYHFIYDTLPYLISYFEIKKENPKLKLLMSYPNSQRTTHYPFVLEFLDILGIKSDDIQIIDRGKIYKTVYISNSYTHDGQSNKPPRKEIYEFYQNIVNRVRNLSDDYTNLPKKIYISRRSWIHNDLSNMGTNYTNRRKLLNEDELVNYLVDLGFVEVFTEKMTTIEKIRLFSNCDYVIGSIGGGLANVLFSKSSTRLLSINSPCFMDINERFKFSFDRVNVGYFDDTYHADVGKFKRYMRVKSGEIIGEISEISKDTLIVDYVDESVAGWNSEMIYKKVELRQEDCTILDGGLNSPWYIDFERFKKIDLNW